MRKWLLGLCLLLFLDTQTAGHLREKTSLQDLRDRGIPTRMLERLEKVGWLPLGGYRIGIRSPGGGYFYYAHLSSYAREFQTGEQIKAGEVLGFLGDTGYGEEGTAGKFVPHLHLGIYVRTQTEEEHALNPYPVLQFLQKRQKNFFY